VAGAIVPGSALIENVRLSNSHRYFGSFGDGGRATFYRVSEAAGEPVADIFYSQEFR
jgi:hypothetical protein